MKKIISLIILLLLVATVSARTVEKEFETKINVTLIHNDSICKYEIQSENNNWDDYLTSSSDDPRIKKYTLNIKRYVEVEDIGGLENLTKAMEQLSKVSLQLADYGNDSKNYQEKYNEEKKGWVVCVENLKTCVKEKDEYKNDSLELDECKPNLNSCLTIKGQGANNLRKCEEDLKNQKASTQNAGIIAGIIGLLVGFGWNKVKEYIPSEKKSFH